MHTRFAIAAIATSALLGTTLHCAAQDPITIRAGTVIDGKGGVQRNIVIAIEGSRIARVNDPTRGRSPMISPASPCSPD